MRLYKYVVAIVSLAMIIVGAVGCSKPAYLDPYGTGDRDPVSNNTIVTRDKSGETTVRFLTPTTTTTTTVPTTTKLVVPIGYRVCPTCHGEKMICEACNGTGKRQGEMLDTSSGIVKRYVTNCGLCSREDPGYYMCETCNNTLIVPGNN